MRGWVCKAIRERDQGPAAFAAGPFRLCKTAADFPVKKMLHLPAGTGKRAGGVELQI